MDGNFDLIKFIDPDAIPYGLVVIVSALVLNRLIASSLDALGERLTERRLQLKNIAAVSRFVVIVLATAAVVGAAEERARESDGHALIARAASATARCWGEHHCQPTVAPPRVGGDEGAER